MPTESYDPNYDPTATSLDPVLTQRVVGPSPTEDFQTSLIQAKRAKTIAKMDAAGPTIRQRTQSEIIDLTLLANRMANPFSIRWIPFEQKREMTCDLMLAFGWWMTMAPILRADFMIECPDAQLAAAVDEALREVVVQYYLAFSNSLWYGHQPLIKNFRLGRLGTTYRDPNGKDPETDLPVWGSSAQALLWRPPSVLNPSHCLPTWDDDGGMTGFKFSNTPIPHFDLISAASAYGYEVIPGHVIDGDRAMWITNEQELNFGSVYGAARTNRAYPYWWSYWYRWRLADRSYENLADPAKYVYYPVDFEQFIDPDDEGGENPAIQQARLTAINIGESIRSGATVAFPGTFAEGRDGQPTNSRKWEAGYYKSQNNFTDLDATFKALDVMKLRSWFTPEQSVIEGTGSRTAGGSSGGTGGARMASQLADVQAESQEGLIKGWDAYVNEFLIPQFIAANFPQKIGTPCKKITGGLGAVDDQTFSQVLTLVGQVRGEVLPVDIRAILKQKGIPLLNGKQMESEIAEIAKLQKMMGPPPTDPSPQGTQGYNAGVEASPNGNYYVQPRERILLSESDGFMNSLPDTPHFQDAGVRSHLVRLRRAFLDRYQEQYDSFSKHIESQPTLHLSDDSSVPKKSGLRKDQAAASAAAIVAVWAGEHAPGAVGAPNVVASTPGIGADSARLVGGIALAGGAHALKSSRLHAEDFDAQALQPWVNGRVKYDIDSVDRTVREEVREWLANELEQSTDPSTVSAAAREHFSGFPASHADRVARTATTEAFNQGTAEALDRAGVSQLQLHDASDGADLKTDSECLGRNGRVVSTQEAKAITLAHPYCTLYFTPLATENLSIVRLPELPSNFAEKGRHVAYDERTETMYLTEEATPEMEQTWLLMLGQQLALR